MNSERPHTGLRTVNVSGVPSVALRAWIISPKIQFIKGKSYSIKVSYRSGSDRGAETFIGVADLPTADDIGRNLLWNISSVDNMEYEEVEIPYLHLGGETAHVGIVVVSIGGLFTQNVFDTLTIEETTLSNQEFDKDFVSITPNPASDFLKLKLKKITATNVSLKIYNTLGELIIKEEKLGLHHLINVSHLSNGLYFARIEDDSGRALVKKIIIK